MRFPYVHEASGVPVLVTAVVYRRVLLDWADLDKHISFKHLEANNEIKWNDAACLFAHTSRKTGLTQQFNARTGIKQAGSVVFVAAVFLILARFVLFVLSVFFPRVVVWAEQKINESWLRAANRPTQLHAAILSGTFFFLQLKKKLTDAWILNVVFWDYSCLLNAPLTLTDMLTQAELSGLSSVEFSVGVKWIHRACVPRRGRVSLGVDVGEGLAGSSWSKSQLQRTQRQPSTWRLAQWASFKPC